MIPPPKMTENGSAEPPLRIPAPPQPHSRELVLTGPRDHTKPPQRTGDRAALGRKRLTLRRVERTEHHGSALPHRGPLLRPHRRTPPPRAPRLPPPTTRQAPPPTSPHAHRATAPSPAQEPRPAPPKPAPTTPPRPRPRATRTPLRCPLRPRPESPARVKLHRRPTFTRTGPQPTKSRCHRPGPGQQQCHPAPDRTSPMRSTPLAATPVRPRPVAGVPAGDPGPEPPARVEPHVLPGFTRSWPQPAESRRRHPGPPVSSTATPPRAESRPPNAGPEPPARVEPTPGHRFTHTWPHPAKSRPRQAHAGR